MDAGSESFRGKFPSIFAQGTRPEMEIRDDARGPAGEFRACGIVATGRYGGSSMGSGPGRDKSPIREGGPRGRERGR
jgi:hypothetical protein